MSKMQTYHPFSRGAVTNRTMAGDRVEKFSQPFFCCQKESRPTENVPQFRQRVLACAQDVDGEVKGSFDTNQLNTTLTGTP